MHPLRRHVIGVFMPSSRVLPHLHHLVLDCRRWVVGLVECRLLPPLVYRYAERRYVAWGSTDLATVVPSDDNEGRRETLHGTGPTCSVTRSVETDCVTNTKDLSSGVQAVPCLWGAKIRRLRSSCGRRV